MAVPRGPNIDPIAAPTVDPVIAPETAPTTQPATCAAVGVSFESFDESATFYPFMVCSFMKLTKPQIRPAMPPLLTNRFKPSHAIE